MNDMKKDPFEEYIKQVEPGKKELGYAWYTAIGLQDVDGLKPSDYLKKTAQDNIDGKISILEANKLIESYYKESFDCDEDRSMEADIVSARIAAILSENAFTFSVPQYVGLHKRLFEGIYSHAGKIRDYNISKKEWILDGESVHYGNALELRELLEYDIRTEKEYEYSFEGTSAIISHLAKFVSGLWQIHAFGEGNTRTTAVFFIKYLRTMGFQVTNDIFAENAWYFRNALVRANYNDLSKGIRETTKFLELFLGNLLLGEQNQLRNRHMHVRWEDSKHDIRTRKQDIETPKQDIDVENQDIREKKQYIKIPKSVGNKTQKHIQNLFEEFGYDKFFGRTEVMQLLKLTASPASELIKKMMKHNLIYPIKGMGKGKYMFVK